MDIQSVSKAARTSLFGNFGTPAEGAAPEGAENAFAALLNLVGVKFNTGSAIGGMESRLMHSNDAAHAAQAEARDDAAKEAPRSLTKAKGTKSDDKDDKVAKDEDDGAAETTQAANDDTANDDTANDAAAADQTQAAVQAAVETTVQLPVAAEVQAGPVVAVVQQVAVAETVSGPVEAAAETVVADAAPEAAAAAMIAQPEKVAEAATAVQETAGPVVAKAKIAAVGPKLAQAAAANVTADDTGAAAETTAEEVSTASAKTIVAKEEGPKETRSAAAVDQSQAMSRQLGDDTKIQVKVQVTGKVAANQAHVDASPYNIYTGYTGTSESSTANGQVGQANATNALVQQAAKSEAQAQVQAAPVILPPQLASQQAPAPMPVARTEAAPIQALESSAPSQSGSGQNNSQNGFASVGGQTQNAQNTAKAEAAQQTATDRLQVTPREIVDQIKVVITRAAKAGLDKVQIQLKPAELGRIDVKLEMSEDHKVRVTVTADNKETLALLQSDSHTLERTLNDAGLRTDSANLHFNLRSEADPREAQNQNQGRSQNGAGGGDAGQEEAAPDYDYAAAARSRGGVDTFA